MTELLALSQDAYHHQILQDLALVCFMAFGVGCLLYGWLRNLSPNLQWNQSGKVTISHLKPIDLLGALIISAPFTHTLLLPYQAPNPAAQDPSNTILVLNFLILLMMSGMVLLIYRQRGVLVEALGLLPKSPWFAAAWGIGGYIGIILIGMVMEQAGLPAWLESRLGEKEVQDVVKQVMNSTDPIKLLILVVGACVVAPLAEEVIFRGYLYPALKRFTDPYLAAIVTGILFGAIHNEVWAMVPLSLFGILLAAIYEWSGSIWSCILAHALFNSINVMIMLSPGFPQP